MRYALVLALVLACPALQAQAQFEAVSIKPNPAGGIGADMKTSPDRLTIAHMSTSELLQWAFGDLRIAGGPDWLDKDRFDVTAAAGTPVELDRTRLQPYLQAMFADRFHLRFHRETREYPNYSLVVAKGGAKLAAHSGEGQPSIGIHANSGTSRMMATKTTMSKLASALGRQTDRAVVDKTGLTGEYDFSLQWGKTAEVESDYPPIFTALQEQLGLKLESTKGPAEVIVIDSIEKPTEN